MNLICFVIERDEIIGLKRFYFQKDKTLNDLFKHFNKMEGIKDDHKRRFRTLSNNRLIYSDMYDKTLEDFDFSQELVRLRLQRGQIPIKGDILLKVKAQSSLLKTQQSELPQKQRIFDPNTPIKEVKEWACQEYQVDPSKHKLYLTDWMKQPIRSLNRQHLTLFEANFGREDTVCLRDIYSPIGEELVHMEMYSTLTGCPDTAEKQGIHVKIEEFKTVRELKELLINTLELGEISPDMLRLRQIKRDYMFGSIWRDDKKSVKSVTVNSNKVVYQVLKQPEYLVDSQIVVVLKKRNRQERKYEDKVIELKFQAGKNPSIQELTLAVKQKLEVGEEIIMAKYVHHQFQWIELSRKNIQLLAKKKKGKQQNKKKGEQPNKGDNNKKDQESNQNKKNEKKGGKKGQKVEVQNNSQSKETQKVKQQAQKEKQEKNTQKQSKVENTQKQQQPKKQKKGGKGGKNEQNQKDFNEQCQNLRKAPVLLKDGDIIGWGIASVLQGDDLQTDEDVSLRIQLKKQPGKVKGGKQQAFQLGVDFDKKKSKGKAKEQQK